MRTACLGTQGNLSLHQPGASVSTYCFAVGNRHHEVLHVSQFLISKESWDATPMTSPMITVLYSTLFVSPRLLHDQDGTIWRAAM